MAKKRIYFETEHTVTTKRKGWIEVEMNYTQIYHAIFNHSKNLKSKYGLHYLLWVMNKANEFNMIPHNEKVLDEFCSEFKDRPSTGTVRNAISELVKNKLLLKYSNASYQLNPILFWSDEVNERIKHIKKLDNFEDMEYELLEETKTKI